MRHLSKSISLMFIFDLLVYTALTSYWSQSLLLPKNIIEYIIIYSIIPLGIATTFLKGHYKIREFNITTKNAYLMLEGVILAHIPTFLLLLVLNINNGYIFILCNIISIFILLMFYRMLFHFYLFKIKRTRNILILGTDKRAKTIAEVIQTKKALKMNVAAFVQLNPDKEEIIGDSNIPIYVMPNNLTDAIKINNIDIVVIAQPTELIIDIPRKVKIYKMPDFYEMATGKYYIDEKTITELFYQFVKNRSYLYDFCKRTYDIIAALIILVVTLPITAYIAIRVKLTDGGSPIFTQTRMGRSGKPFECYKLRTMYQNSYVPKNANNVKYAESVKSDDRIMPFCKFVRKARFDEIPQMINILKGEMSIVGPRAEWIDEAKIFQEKIPYYNCRMWTKTGWTGWSHINMQPVFSVDEEKERLEYDLYYIKHRNVLWEICILVKAVFLALGGRHA